MSIGFMLPDPDEAIIWRGSRKNGLIKNFLKEVYWNELDFLVKSISAKRLVLRFLGLLRT